MILTNLLIGLAVLTLLVGLFVVVARWDVSDRPDNQGDRSFWSRLDGFDLGGGD